MKHNDRRVRRCAVDCLIQLHDSSIIKHWGPASTLVNNFWRISSQTVLYVARQILDNRLNEEIIKSLLELLSKILMARNTFLAGILVKKKKKNEICDLISYRYVNIIVFLGYHS
jgi:neurofibromin 1